MPPDGRQHRAEVEIADHRGGDGQAGHGADDAAARQAEPEVITANEKEPAVALAQSILSDEAVRELAKQAGVPFSSSTSGPAEFRSRLDMAQASPGLLHVNYKDTDKKVSAAVAKVV